MAVGLHFPLNDGLLRSKRRGYARRVCAANQREFKWLSFILRARAQ